MDRSSRDRGMTSHFGKPEESDPQKIEPGFSMEDFNVIDGNNDENVYDAARGTFTSMDRGAY